MNKLKILFNRIILRTQNTGLIQTIKYIPVFIFKEKKINLDKIKIKENTRLDKICFQFGTDKAYLDGKKTFYKIDKDAKTKKRFPNYLSWILRPKQEKFNYELGLNYSKYYEKYFLPIRLKKLKILEIGVAAGHSVASWYKYFPNSTIFGVDIKDESFLLYKGKRMRYDVLDCMNFETVKNYCDKYGKFDIIIDDSYHDHPFFEFNIKNFFPYLSKGGIYFLVDFRDSDDKLKKIRNYNKNFKKKLMGYEITMEEKFKFFKRKKLFKDEIFSNQDLKMIYKNLEKVNVHYPGHPVSSLAALIKKK